MQTTSRPVPQSLETLRGEIDRIDDALLGLVERRATLSASIAALKSSEGQGRLRLRPRREAEVVERLIRRAHPANHRMITHVWRALMSHALQSQAPMRLVLTGTGDRLAMQDAVRARFGPAAALRWVDDLAEALRIARTSEAVAAVLQPCAPDLQDDELVAFDRIDTEAGCVWVVGRIAPDDIADDLR